MWRQIFRTTVLAGSLDILAAFAHAYFKNGTSPEVVLKYIASGMFGDKAFEGGIPMILAGLGFHFAVAFACVTVFFVAYPKLKILHHSILVNSLIIALVAWAVTNLIVVPLSKIGTSPFELTSALTAIGILFLCVGLPIAYAAKDYFSKGVQS